MADDGVVNDDDTLRGLVYINELTSEPSGLCKQSRFQVNLSPGLLRWGTIPVDRTLNVRSFVDIRISAITSSCVIRSKGKPLIRNI